MAGMLSVALTGIGAAQAGLTTTSHNIANANVVGYSRQEAVQSTNDPMFSGVGFFGQGTHIQTVRRIYSQFLENQVLNANSARSQYETYSNEISQIDNLLADETAGLAPTLQEFFRGVQQVAASPSSIPSRQSMLSSSEALVSRFHALHDRLEEVRAGVESQIKDSVASINNLSSQIAAVNQRLTIVQSAGDGLPANDLLDQRNKLIDELNIQIKVTVTEADDGKVNIFVGNGQPVVVGSESFRLAAASSLDDPQSLAVGFELTTAPVVKIQELPDSLVTGGVLSGLLQFRNEALNRAENALGRIALGLTNAVNAQHRLGQDLNGLMGGDYFAPLSVATTNLVNTATGLASTATVSAVVSNLGNVQADDYVLSFDGTNYQLSRDSDGSVVYAGAGPLTNLDGMNVTIGAMVAGDRVLIQPVRNAAAEIAVAVRDPRLIAAAAPIATAKANTNAGTASISVGSVNSLTGIAATAPHIGNISLVFNAGTNQFTVTGALPATVAYNPAVDASGLNVTLTNPDISFTLSGVPVTGDTFTIQSNASGVSDNRNALLLGGLQSKKILEGGGASFEYAYSQMVSDIGTMAHTASVNQTAQDTLLSEARAKQQSVSGVNLDEEAANLMRYQQAYQASAKALTIASQLFSEILSIGR
ncbi:MAG: flagellar hook-associated protein FlgK [Pseudomonadota bacterium]|nr:flagellar hook-associated protein FlgK [Uliginosibacterium sp.]